LNAVHHRILTVVSETRESLFSIQSRWTSASGALKSGPTAQPLTESSKPNKPALAIEWLNRFARWQQRIKVSDPLGKQTRCLSHNTSLGKCSCERREFAANSKFTAI
jgi:hypothetical protein